MTSGARVCQHGHYYRGRNTCKICNQGKRKQQSTWAPRQCEHPEGRYILRFYWACPVCDKIQEG